MKVLVGLGNPGSRYARTRHNVGFIVLTTLISTDGTQISTDRIGGNLFLNLCKSVSGWKLNKKLESEEVVGTMVSGERVILAKPQTLMNASGRAVKKVLNFYKAAPADLLVVHDDLDLRLGEFKLQRAKGPKIHYGLNSIAAALKTEDFWRLRIGVDNRGPGARTPGEAYVLQDFSEAEAAVIKRLVRAEIRGRILDWLERGGSGSVPEAGD